MSALIILTLVCALTYTFEIVFGLAGTIQPASHVLDTLTTPDMLA